MSSDTLVKPSPNETLTYSPPRDPDTDDTIARLYFGPHNSPEKRLIKTMLANDDTPPRRRSARLVSHTANNSPSSAPVQVLEQQPEELDRLVIFDSGHDTPNNNDDLQDEPSSALADRIIRAHDNPSPPPNCQFLPIDEPQSVSPILHPFQGDLTPSGTPNVTLPPLALPESPLAVVSDLSVPDLMSFASCSIPPSTSLDLHRSEVTGPSSVPTVDDLLSRSPTPPQDALFTKQILGKSPVKRHNGKARRSTTDGTSANVLDHHQLQPSPSLRPQYLVQESQPPPLRRSKRNSSSPQRSATPFDNGLSAPLERVAPLRLAGSSTGDRKTPLEIKDLPPPAGTSEVGRNDDYFKTADSDERTGRKRKRPDGDVTKVWNSRLGSLSPDSTSVLQQLMPVTKADSDTEVQTVRSPQKPPSSNLPHRIPILPQLGRFSTPSKPRDTLGGTNWTPVRRVPIESVLGQAGSPWKGQPGTRTFGGTVFRTQALDDPSRSPARRVLIASVLSSPKKAVSDAAVFSRDRSGTIEPRPDFKTRSASAEPVFSRPPNSAYGPNTKVATTLPFPVTPKPPAILEEEEDGVPPSPIKPRATSAPPVVPMTPVKSILRQPTVSSRIPRMGVKPYARPPASEKSKLPVPTPRLRTPNISARPLSNVGSSSGSSSDDARSGPTHISALKRKRVTDSKPSSFTRFQPQVVIMRQAPGIRAHERPKQPPPPNDNDQQNAAPSSEDAVNVPKPNPVKFSDSPEEQITNSQPEGSVRSTRPRDGGIPAQFGTRRTSRLRNAHPLNDDVFGSNSGTSVPAPRPIPAKRKPPSDKSGYAGLSSIALKNLTTNNTAKNQQIVNKLETELVRKEGKRPESPTTKLRTISERQKEEKSQQRKERAERRARKIELGEIGESDMDLSFMSDVPIGDDGQPLKHRRGPGDEEDYETPERFARPSKRTKIDGGELNESEEKNKRVQWDRGLFTAVYLDELPDSRIWPKTENVKKSCLARGAKAVRLDPLGNLQNSDAPATHIVTERIVVKRFVYEDEEPGVEPVPETKPLKVVKSKGRKAKS